MSVSFRVGAHLNCVVGHLRRSSVVIRICHQKTRNTTVRHISWMPFEQPDPSLYPPPPSLQPKRPVIAEAVSSVNDGTVTQATVIGKMGTAPATAARAQGDPASGKPVPTSLPASAMQTGPTPLSQIQKRTFSTSAAICRKKSTDGEDSQGQSTSDPEPAAPPPQPTTQDTNQLPTLHIHISGHPATWPVQGPTYPSSSRHGDTGTRN
ncbi:hypothetical protein F5Y12DRAFT_793871 [Xylaria sp. FL1777]|nr:hypothetical protein F5Y12DRAFT_793871 [Xylaria sp. FL1777]